MTAPARHSGCFTAAELDEIAAQRESLDADYFRRMAADQRYPVMPLHHPAVATRTPRAYATRILNSPTL